MALLELADKLIPVAPVLLDLIVHPLLSASVTKPPDSDSTTTVYELVFVVILCVPLFSGLADPVTTIQSQQLH